MEPSSVSDSPNPSSSRGSPFSNVELSYDRERERRSERERLNSGDHADQGFDNGRNTVNTPNRVTVDTELQPVVDNMNTSTVHHTSYRPGAGKELPLNDDSSQELVGMNPLSGELSRRSRDSHSPGKASLSAQRLSQGEAERGTELTVNPFSDDRSPIAGNSNSLNIHSAARLKSVEDAYYKEGEINRSNRGTSTSQNNDNVVIDMERIQIQSNSSLEKGRSHPNIDNNVIKEGGIVPGAEGEGEGNNSQPAATGSPAEQSEETSDDDMIIAKPEGAGSEDDDA